MLNPISRNPPVPYWDLWPSGQGPSQQTQEQEMRRNIRESSLPDEWQTYFLPVWTEQSLGAGANLENTVRTETLGWIFKIEYLAVTADQDLFLSCSDSSSGKVLFDGVCTLDISGGDLGKSYAGFAYLLGPRFPLSFKIENRSGGTLNPSLILLGKLYRGDL